MQGTFKYLFFDFFIRKTPASMYRSTFKCRNVSHSFNTFHQSEDFPIFPSELSGI